MRGRKGSGWKEGVGERHKLTQYKRDGDGSKIICEGSHAQHII